jgi:hypothetical protein
MLRKLKNLIKFHSSKQKGYFTLLPLLLLLLYIPHTIEIYSHFFEHALELRRIKAFEIAAHRSADIGNFLQNEINKAAIERIKVALQAYVVERSKLIETATVRTANGNTTINATLVTPAIPSDKVWSINRPNSLLKTVPNKTNQTVPYYDLLYKSLASNTTFGKQQLASLEAAKEQLRNNYDYNIGVTFVARQVISTGKLASVAGRPIPSIELYRWVATVHMMLRSSYGQKLPMRFDYDIVALITTPTPDIAMSECQQPTVNHTINPPFDTRVRFFCREVLPDTPYDNNDINTSGKTQYDCHSTLDLWANAEIDPEKFGPIKRKYLDNGGLEDIMDAVKGKVDPFAFGGGERNPNTKGLLIVGDNTSPNAGKTTVDCTSFGQSPRDPKLTNNAVLLGVTTKQVSIYPGFEIAQQPLR